MDKINIRRATKEDIGLVRNLVMELAIFEKAPEEVTSSLADYIQEGFSDNPLFTANLIYLNDELAGFSLWYYRFSTWKGRRFYLEDLYIKEAHRRRGIGENLITLLKKEMIEKNLRGMIWQVLEWNDLAINFYKKLDASFDSEWVNCSIVNDAFKS